MNTGGQPRNGEARTHSAKQRTNKHRSQVDPPRVCPALRIVPAVSDASQSPSKGAAGTSGDMRRQCTSPVPPWGHNLGNPAHRLHRIQLPHTGQFLIHTHPPPSTLVSRDAPSFYTPGVPEYAIDTRTSPRVPPGKTPWSGGRQAREPPAIDVALTCTSPPTLAPQIRRRSVSPFQPIARGASCALDRCHHPGTGGRPGGAGHSQQGSSVCRSGRGS